MMLRLSHTVIGFINYEYIKFKVATPKALTYPDLLMDGLRFYDLIGSPRLKLKYSEDKNDSDSSSEEFGMDDVKTMVYKQMKNISAKTKLTR